MSTLPPEPAGTETHQARQVAESFGADAERYDRARPRYPDALVERVVATSPGRDFLDVGTGTGIAARQFQAAGRDVLGIDPDERMAGLARQAGVKVEVASFEDWDDAGRRFDAIIAGMAWHWVDPAAGAAKAARVLRPGGRVALFWYVLEPPSDVRESFRAVYQRVLSDSPFFRGALPTLDAYSVIFDKAEAGLAAVGAFGPPERWRFDWERRYTRDQWLEQVPTFGGFSRIPASGQADLLAGLGEAVDSVGGSFVARYATVVVTTTRRLPAPGDRLGDGDVAGDELECLTSGTRRIQHCHQHGRDIGSGNRPAPDRIAAIAQQSLKQQRDPAVPASYHNTHGFTVPIRR